MLFVNQSGLLALIRLPLGLTKFSHFQVSGILFGFRTMVSVSLCYLLSIYLFEYL